MYCRGVLHVRILANFVVTNGSTKAARRRSKTRGDQATGPSRRHAMIWMLREAGASVSAIAAGFRVSKMRIRAILRAYEEILALRARRAALSADPAMARLRAAGAI